MKKTDKLKSVLLFTIAVLLVPLCVSAQDGYHISITVHGTEDTIAYMGHHFGHQRYLNDTAVIVNDKAVFEGNEPLPEGMYFYYTQNAYFEFAIGNHNFSIETRSPEFIQNMEIKNSRENKIFNDLQNTTLRYQTRLKELQEKLENMDENDQKSIELREQIAQTQDEFRRARNQFANEYPDTFVARFVKAINPPTWAGYKPEMEPRKRYSMFKKHYFDGIDLTDESLLRSPAYHPLIMDFMDKVTIQNPDSIISSVDYILESVENNPTIFRYALVTLTQKYETSKVMGMDKVFVHLAEKYYLTGKATWIDEEVRKKIRDRVNNLKPNLIGNPAPPLILVDTMLRQVKLNAINAEYTVLYFFDPDCGHCKKMTPILRDSYAGSLKEMDVEVVGICITDDLDKWKKFIKEYDLTWVNVVDAKNSRRSYDIQTTPTIYVLDKNKHIVAKKIDAEDVEKVINYLRNSSS